MYTHTTYADRSENTQRDDKRQKQAESNKHEQQI